MVANLRGFFLCSVVIFGFFTLTAKANNDDELLLQAIEKGHVFSETLGSCKEGEIISQRCIRCVCHHSELKCIFVCNRKQEAILNGFNGERTRISRTKRQTAPLTADLEKTPCAPNDYFQIDCNTCYCKMDRTGYLCTENIACQEITAETLPTTTHIPMSEGAVLIISDRGPQLVENVNSNDNSLSRIPNSVTEKNHHTSPLQSLLENNFSNTNRDDVTTPGADTAVTY